MSRSAIVCARKAARGPLTRRTLRFLAVLPLVVLVASCRLPFEEGFGNGVLVQNGTSSTLHFRELVDGEWYDFASASPGNAVQLIDYAALTTETSLVGRNGCTIGVFVAYDSADREVARHGPGLCLGDTWVIGTVGPNPTSWVEHDR